LNLEGEALVPPKLAGKNAKASVEEKESGGIKWRG